MLVLDALDAGLITRDKAFGEISDTDVATTIIR